MVVPSNSASKPKVPAQKECMEVMPKCEKNGADLLVGANGGQGSIPFSLPKRTKNPGVRVIGGRVYDSESGKTCHQCRQKTLDFMASCKNHERKFCTIKFCHKCLLNRYGEKAEEMDLVDVWKCPKCRGICNCSVCMKKRGHKPTGILVLRAKASGFSSVSEMLHFKGPENCGLDNDVKLIAVSPNKLASSKPIGKENSFDGNNDSDSHVQKFTPNPDKKLGRKKQKGLKEKQSGTGEDGACMKKNAQNLAPSTKNVALSKKTSQNLAPNPDEKVIAVSPNKLASSKPIVALPSKRGKGNSFAGNKDSDSHIQIFTPNPNKQLERKKQKGLKEKQSGTGEDGVCMKKNDQNLAPCTQNVALSKKISQNLAPNPDEKKPKRKKLEGFMEMHGEDGDCLKKSSQILVPNADVKALKRKKLARLKEVQSGFEDDSALLNKNSFKKFKPSNEISSKEVKTDRKNGNGVLDEEDSKTSVCSEDYLDSIKEGKKERNCPLRNDAEVSNRVNIENAILKTVKNHGMRLTDTMKFEKKGLEADIQLPQGADLTVVAGLELPPDDVGYALQFLEFCAVFDTILDVKKGQPERILRDLMHWRGSRRRQYSSAIQFHIQLLSMILKDMGEESPILSLKNGNHFWLQAFGKCISESQCGSKELPLDCFDQGGSGYDNLEFSKKLRLLNFLCDEILGTVDMRTWMEDENKKFLAKKKEAEGNFLIAKTKTKSVNQKLRNEVAKTIIAKNGAPLSIADHEAIVSQIKAEAAQAHAELVEAMDMIPKEKRNSNAIRANPILIDEGRIYWKLKSFSHGPNVLLQDNGSWGAVVPSEKWFIYDEEERKVIEKYISSLGGVLRRKSKKSSHTHLCESEANLQA